LRTSGVDKERVKRRRTTSQYDWIKRHLGYLLEIKNRYLGADSASPQDVEYGFWSLKKLIAINYLIPQFGRLALTGNFTHCFYLDLLAGSGVLRVEGDIFPGSAIVALAAKTTSPHFEKYYFIESDMAKAALLKNRLGRIAASLQNKEHEVTKEDCNVALPRILNEIYRVDPEHSCFLALLDPEGYTETEWSTVGTLLSRGKGDMIFNFTEGVARNVEKAKTDPSYINSLRKYFGESEENLFRLEGYEQLIDHFRAELVSINGIRRTVFRIDVRDEENRPLYGLLLATGSTGFANIMNDLKRRLDSTRARDLKNIYYELTGRSKSLNNFR